jgi:uncharacterized membrane protein YphA (DoxX/SURF4 family)
MRSAWTRITATEAPPAVVLVRLALAFVFVSEGVQKFLYADALGVGRFAKIGIPAPELMAPFVGAVETVGGLLLLLGLLTRPAALALAIDMVVAIVSTKIPILVGHGVLGFADPPAGRTGLLAMAHEARTDVSMLLGAIFLLLVGAGTRSIDARISRMADER